MYCPSSFIISYRHPCAVLQLGHPRVHPFLGLATILVPLSVLPGPQCYLDFPLVNSVSLRFSFLTTLQYLSLVLKTYWLNGAWVSPLTCLKIHLCLLWLFGFLGLLSNLSHIHCCCRCLSHKAFDVCFGQTGQPNPLLPRLHAGM